MVRWRDVAIVGGLVAVPVAIGVGWWYTTLPVIEYCFDEGGGDILHDRSIRDWFNNARLSGNYKWKDRILEMNEAQAEIENPISLGDFTIELTITPLRDARMEGIEISVFYLEQRVPEGRYVYIWQSKGYGNRLAMWVYTGRPYPIARAVMQTPAEPGYRLHVAFTRKVGEYTAVYREEGGVWYLEYMEADRSPLPVEGRAYIGFPRAEHKSSIHIWENLKIYPYVTIEPPTESKTEY
ncbi:MAG: hypothetical protein DRP01_10895 [Archaeoglobales archaeon]|nr:MAG: hypothetical protein DRP01_10895 [Archaeoglobales archaeon]